MEYTLTFDEIDTAALNAALIKRPDFATVTEFLQSHCQGAVNAGREDLRTLAIEEFERSGSFPSVIEVEKRVRVVIERDPATGELKHVTDSAIMAEAETVVIK